MILEGYGVRLRSITESDLELMRQWRNDGQLNQFLLNRDYISADAQGQWFEKLDKAVNLFFMIEVKDTSIGFIALKEIDWSAGTAVSNILVGDTGYSATPFPVFASMLLTEFFFFILKGSRIYSTTFKNNVKALELDKKLGYRIEKEQKNLLITYTERGLYLTAAKSLRKIAQKVAGTKGKLRVTVEQYNVPNFKFMIDDLNATKYKYLYKSGAESGTYEFDLSHF